MKRKATRKRLSKYTVGHVRKLIEGLPDDAVFSPVWKDGPPSDAEPGVRIFGFERRKDDGRSKDDSEFIAVLVGLFYLLN